jgi:NTE family protein
MSSDYFCIFAGGGIRGVAYIGALQAFKQYGINITGLAGSSVGAIFASLYAVGFDSEEIKEIAFNTNFELFSDLNFKLGKNFGFCKGDSFLQWFREKIERKYYGDQYEKDVNKPVKFKDLTKDLVIIATNLSNGTCKVHSKIETPDEEIAKAVRASISIPGFFKPVWNNDECLIDGDIVGNFPSWRFENYLLSNTDSRILELRLENIQTPRKISNPVEYFNAILDSTYNVSSELLSRLYGQNDCFDLLRIDVGNVSIIDFNMSARDRETLINKGFDSVKFYFDKSLLEKKKLIFEIYTSLYKMLEIILKEVSANKIHKASVLVGELALFAFENKEVIKKDIFSQIVAMREVFKNNINLMPLLNITTLKNKEEVVKSTKYCLKNIEVELQRLKAYIDKYGND